MTPCERSGKLIWRGRQQRAPGDWLRWLYEKHVGPVPPGHHLHHVCGNPWCANWRHLEALTPEAHRAAHRGNPKVRKRPLPVLH